MRVGGMARGDRGEGGAPLLRHDLRAPRGIPGAHQLDVGKMFRQPQAALAQRHRVGEHPLDSLELRAGHRHERVVHRVEDLVGQPERAVAERLFQQVVGRRDRADE
jgi:hypothetical protein